MGALFSGVGAKFYLGGPLYLSLFSPTLVLLEFLIIIIIFLGMVFNFSLMCVFFFFALFGSYLIEEVEVGGGALKKGLGGSWRSPLHKPVTGKGRYAHVLTGGRVWRGAVPLWARDLRDREMTPLPLRLCWSVRLFQSLARSTSPLGFLVEEGSGVTRGLGVCHARSLFGGPYVGLGHKRPSWLSIIDWSTRYYHSITVIITIKL